MWHELARGAGTDGEETQVELAGGERLRGRLLDREAALAERDDWDDADLQGLAQDSPWLPRLIDAASARGLDVEEEYEDEEDEEDEDEDEDEDDRRRGRRR